MRSLRGCCSGCVLSIFLALVFVATIATCAKGQGHPRWLDGVTLLDVADSVHIDDRAMLAMAWEESRENLSPSLRGHRCWYTHRMVVADSVVVRKHHEPDCEVGRYQIKPSTARRRCPGLNVFTYTGNIRCFAKMFAEDTEQHDRIYAITHHNGRGPRAREYLTRVLAVIGWIAVTYPEPEKT